MHLDIAKAGGAAGGMKYDPGIALDLGAIFRAIFAIVAGGTYEQQSLPIQAEPVAAIPSALAASLVLAPRPDPEHPNPDVVAEQKASSGSVILKILVSADGSVAEATVRKTSGTPAADQSAIAFVKTKWKFLPALLDGNPIQYWTTVIVRLS